MRKKYGIVSLCGLLICLFFMYGTQYGIPGITQYSQEFKLFDMQFSYTYAAMVQTLKSIGSGGILHYQYYLVIDFFFIICLLLFQLYLNQGVAKDNLRFFLMILVIIRALLDLAEDTILMLVLREQISIKQSIISICSNITSCKFLCLYVWLTIMCFWWIINRRNSKRCKDNF